MSGSGNSSLSRPETAASVAPETASQSDTTERLAAWLNRRRIAIAAAALLIAEIAIFLFLVAGTHGWIVPLDRPTTTDFASFYAAGTLTNAGTPWLAYDHAAHLAAEEAATSPGIEYQYFNYPPVYLLLCSVFALLPYLVAYVLFIGASWLLYLVVACHILRDRSATTLLVLLAFPMGFWNIGLGQNAFLTAGLFGSATLLLDRRPAAAGLLFGLLCYKPQLGLMLPFALAAGGHWRCFAAATATVGGLVLLTLGLFGPQTWHDFLLTAGGSHAVYESGRILFAGFANAFGAVRLLGGGIGLAYAVQGIAALAAAIAVVMTWRRGLSLSTRAAVLAAASVVAAPVILFYDLVLATVAALWLIRGEAWLRLAPGEKLALAGLFLLLIDARHLAEHWHVPAAPLAALGLFALTIRRGLRETKQLPGAATL